MAIVEVHRRDPQLPPVRSEAHRDRGVLVTVVVVAVVAVGAFTLGFATGRHRSPRREQPPDQDHVEGTVITVTRVRDGDTLLGTTRDGIVLVVRLAHVDAPERDQDYGLEATQWLAGTLEGKAVRLAPDGVDRYNRVIGRLSLGDRLINLDLVRSGAAWCAPGHARPDFAQAEQDARGGKRGLWQKDDPTPPWVYRQTHGER